MVIELRQGGPPDRAVGRRPTRSKQGGPNGYRRSDSGGLVLSPWRTDAAEVPSAYCDGRLWASVIAKNSRSRGAAAEVARCDRTTASISQTSTPSSKDLALKDDCETSKAGRHTRGETKPRQCGCPNRNASHARRSLSGSPPAKGWGGRAAFHSGDHLIYPDCRHGGRRARIMQMRALEGLQEIDLQTPLCRQCMTKQRLGRIVRSPLVPVAETGAA